MIAKDHLYVEIDYRFNCLYLVYIIYVRFVDPNYRFCVVYTREVVYVSTPLEYIVLFI